MQLERMAVAVRPRSGWESLDLGFQMARRWWRELWAVWLALYVPVAVLAMTAFSNKFYAFVFLWWLKPLFDRALLHVLSRLVFSESTSVADTLKAVGEWTRPGLFLGLTLRRLEMARSFVLPVAALEKQTGKAAGQRRAMLGSRLRGTGIWLTVVCLHLEFIAMLALFGLGNLLLPSAGEIPGQAGDSGGDMFGLAALTTWNLVDAVCYAGAVSLIEPFYVAAGFSLYLNRRTILEGWDMEMRLRQLGNRLRSAAMAAAGLLLSVVLLTGITPGNADAADPAKPDAAHIIEQVLADPAFDQYREVTLWRSLETREKPKQGPRLGQFWRNLALLLSDISQRLLWISVAVGALLLIYVLRKYVPESLARKSDGYAPPSNLFGLNVAPQSLPPDVAGSARQLAQQGRLREALSLLYRGALSALMHRYRLALHAGDTEGDCATAATRVLDRPAASYFSKLVMNWQLLAYGGAEPAANQIDALCRDWPAHFDSTATPPAAQATTASTRQTS